MNDKTLLPCPFCGGAPKSGDSSYGYWRVYCPDDNHCGVSPFGDGSTEAEAIAAWNTRAPQATRIEALEAALRETMSRCTDCGGRGSFVKHDEVTDRDLWESCASCAVGYAALESQP